MDDSSSPPLTERKVDNHAAIEPRITDLVRFGVVGLFAYWSFTLVAPFLVIVIWAAILVVALYPVYQALRTVLGGRSRLAAIVVTILCLGVILGPLAAIALNFVDATQLLLLKLREGSLHLPLPAESVRDWPLIGERVYAAWSLASSNFTELFKRFEPALLETGGFVLGKVASVGLGLVSFVASVIIAGVLFGPAPRLAIGIRTFAQRIAGDRGVGFVTLAGATIRNVARGVIGVALLQTLLAGVVFSIFDIPAASVLTFVVLILCIVQIGPALILFPVMVWAWMALDPVSALILTALLIPIGLIDNVIKPILVARGLSTPMLVILLGVLGGTLSYGLIGLFLGPIVLSVFYDLLVAWVRVQPPSENVSSSEPQAPTAGIT
ncbi:AI-2E family transporter [Rhizobium sp. LjRoot258]|jgi:predicted PurR-regulated permease PerM|uniref:AI-2E family transporter n=1 Tax=Rhizobium sp. LjRoot258 TaxID=3342299 RepID=UPI003ECFA5DA